MKRVLLLLTFLPFLLVQCLQAQSTDVIRLAETAIESGLLKGGGGTHRLHVGVGFPNKIVTGLRSVNLLDNIAGIDLGSLGIGDLLGLDGNNRLEGEGSSTPQFNISFDFAINEKLSIGPYFGYAQAKTPILVLDTPEIPGVTVLGIEIFRGLDAIQGSYQYDFKVISYGLRAVVNPFEMKNEKLQIYVVGYAGLTRYIVEERVISGDARGLETAGIIDQLFADDSFNSTTPNLSLAGQVGGRYNFSPKMGIFLEAGVGLNIFSAGLIFNFHKQKHVQKVQAAEDIDVGDLKGGTSN